jgi:hypothetical protein
MSREKTVALIVRVWFALGLTIGAVGLIGETAHAHARYPGPTPPSPTQAPIPSPTPPTPPSPPVFEAGPPIDAAPYDAGFTFDAGR